MKNEIYIGWINQNNNAIKEHEWFIKDLRQLIKIRKQQNASYRNILREKRIREFKETIIPTQELMLLEHRNKMDEKEIHMLKIAIEQRESEIKELKKAGGGSNEGGV